MPATCSLISGRSRTLPQVRCVRNSSFPAPHTLPPPTPHSTPMSQVVIRLCTVVPTRVPLSMLPAAPPSSMGISDAGDQGQVMVVWGSLQSGLSQYDPSCGHFSMTPWVDPLSRTPWHNMGMIKAGPSPQRGTSLFLKGTPVVPLLQLATGLPGLASYPERSPHPAA